MNLTWWQILWILPLLLQAFALLADEFYFHRKRGLGYWESWGHPVDIMCFLLFIGWIETQSWSESNFAIALGFAAISCLIITKDEWVHQKEASLGETWLHSFLFVLHPIVIASLLLAWPIRDGENLPWKDWMQPLLPVFKWYFAPALLMLIHQIFYWNFLNPSSSQKKKS